MEGSRALGTAREGRDAGHRRAQHPAEESSLRNFTSMKTQNSLGLLLVILGM